MKKLLFNLSILIMLTTVVNAQTEMKTIETNPGTVVELAPFFIKEGVLEKELLEASARVQTDFIEKQPGFIKRELLKKSDQEYLDIVYWQSEKAAKNAAEKAMQSEICHKFFQLMNLSNPNGGLSHYQIVKSYN